VPRTDLLDVARGTRLLGDHRLPININCFLVPIAPLVILLEARLDDAGFTRLDGVEARQMLPLRLSTRLLPALLIGVRRCNCLRVLVKTTLLLLLVTLVIMPRCLRR
jgi:hypothetical protein